MMIVVCIVLILHLHPSRIAIGMIIVHHRRNECTMYTEGEIRSLRQWLLLQKKKKHREMQEKDTTTSSATFDITF